jgi:hypothetical protein
VRWSPRRRGPRWSSSARFTRAFGPNWSTWLTRGLEAGALAGLVVFLARELRHLRRAQRGVLRATLASEELVGRARSLAARLGVRPPGVRVLPGLSSPFVWGAWGTRRALLVLPERRTADTVLTHELAHLARRDHAVAWLELVVLGLCWWNPLAWLARRAWRSSQSCRATRACWPASPPSARATRASWSTRWPTPTPRAATARGARGGAAAQGDRLERGRARASVWVASCEPATTRAGRPRSSRWGYSRWS